MKNLRFPRQQRRRRADGEARQASAEAGSPARTGPGAPLYYTC